LLAWSGSRMVAIGNESLHALRKMASPTGSSVGQARTWGFEIILTVLGPRRPPLAIELLHREGPYILVRLGQIPHKTRINRYSFDLSFIMSILGVDRSASLPDFWR